MSMSAESRSLDQGGKKTGRGESGHLEKDEGVEDQAVDALLGEFLVSLVLIMGMVV